MKKTKRHDKKTLVKGAALKSCHGHPVPVPFEIQGFKGMKCDVCLEVLEYKSDGTNLIED